MKIWCNCGSAILVELKAQGHKLFSKIIISEMFMEGNALFWMTKARCEDERNEICQQNSTYLLTLLHICFKNFIIIILLYYV
jgi:hypothetical protein